MMATVSFKLNKVELKLTAVSQRHPQNRT